MSATNAEQLDGSDPNGRGLLGEGLPTIGEAHAHFVELITANQSERARDIYRAMGGIIDLSTGFAVAMKEAGMRVDRVIEDIRNESPDVTNDFDPPVVRRVSHPLWVVLKDQDLSGNEMRRATIVNEVPHYSLLSYTYSGSHNEFRDVGPDEALTMELGCNETLNFYEKAIAVSALGDLLVLYRSFLKGQDLLIPDRARDTSFRVLSKAVQPSDLFDVKGLIDPKIIVSKMQERMAASLEQYRANPNMDCEDGSRPPQYYEIEELPVPRLDNHKKVGRIKGLFGRLGK
jgi:hypothetical protein